MREVVKERTGVEGGVDSEEFRKLVRLKARGGVWVWEGEYERVVGELERVRWELERWKRIACTSCRREYERGEDHQPSLVEGGSGEGE